MHFFGGQELIESTVPGFQLAEVNADPVMLVPVGEISADLCGHTRSRSPASRPDRVRWCDGSGDWRLIQSEFRKDLGQQILAIQVRDDALFHLAVFTVRLDGSDDSAAP